MSISARSTKTTMYGEIERLRLELDRERFARRDLAAKNEELRAKVRSLEETKLVTPSRLIGLRDLAIKLGTTVRRIGDKTEAFIDGQWTRISA